MWDFFQLDIHITVAIPRVNRVTVKSYDSVNAMNQTEENTGLLP